MRYDLTARAKIRLGHLALHLRENVEKFDMAAYMICGSPSCIAGHAIDLLDKNAFDYISANGKDWEIHGRATSLLDIDEKLALELFTPSARIGVDIYSCSAGQAADVIEHLVLTGELDWSRQSVRF